MGEAGDAAAAIPPADPPMTDSEIELLLRAMALLVRRVDGNFHAMALYDQLIAAAKARAKECK